MTPDPKFPYQPGMTVSATFFCPGIGTVLGNATVDSVTPRNHGNYWVNVTLHNPGKATPQQSYIVQKSGSCDHLMPRPVQH